MTWKLESENPRDLYRKLRGMIHIKPPDGPSENQIGPNVELHLCTFLECIKKYASSHSIEIRPTNLPATDDVIIAIDARSLRLVLPPTPQDHTFVLRLRKVLQFGVYHQQIEAFRELFYTDPHDDKRFFHIGNNDLPI